MPLEKTSIQLKWFHQFQFAGYYAALEKGFYADEGLDVDLIERDPSVNNVDQVLNGKSEYGVADAGILHARQKGKPVTVLGQIFQYSPLVYITLPDSGLRTPYDLVGKKVMTESFGYADAPLKAMVVKELGGLDKVRFKPHTFRNEDLLEGRVDAMLAYSSNEPFWFKERGINVNIIDPRDYGIDFYGDNLFTTDEELRNHPERSDKVLRATLKGWKYAVEHKDEIIDLIMQKYNTQSWSREHLVYEADQVEMLVNPHFVEIGHIEPSRYQKIAGIYTSLGLVDKFKVNEQFYFQSQKPKVELTLKERAWLNAHPEIRLGVDSAFPPFEFIGKQGDYLGMAAEYLALINESLGTDMQIVSGLSWSEVIEKAQKHEIDVLPTVGKTETRSAYLNFTRPYLSFPLVFMTRKDQEPVDGFGDLVGRKLAMAKDYYYVEEVLKKYPNIEPYFVDSPLDALKELTAGNVDAVISNFAVANHLILKHGFTSVRIDAETSISGGEFGYAVRKDWPEFVSILNKALASISEEKQNEIHDRWLTEDPIEHQKVSLVKLTTEEKAWLKAHPVLRVSSETDYAPFDFQIDGKPVGYSIDYLKLVARRLGIRLDFVKDSWEHLLKKAEKRELDLVHTIFNSPAERENYLNFTKPYKRVINAIVTKDGVTNINSLNDLKSKSVALVKADSVAMLIPEILPDAKHLYFEDYSAVLKAISLGQADAAVLELPTAVYLIRQLSLTNLKIAAEVTELGNRDQSYRLAVRKDWPILVTILEKAMDSLRPEELAPLESAWMTLPSATGGVRSVVLTEEERAWLKANPRIRVHNEMDWPPFNFHKNGQPQGLSIDFMNLLAKSVGLEVDYVSGPSWNDFLAMMKTSELDVMLNIVKTPDREQYLIFTESYSNNPNTILSLKKKPYQAIEQLFGKTVAIPKGFFYEELLKKDYSEIKILAVKNSLETMKAVSYGKADAAFGELAVFNHLIDEHLMTDVTVLGEVDLGNPEYSLLNIATRKDLPILASILMKGMDSLGVNEQQEIKRKWLGESIDSSAQPLPKHVVFDQANFILKSLAIIISMLLLVIVGFWMVKKRKRHLSIRHTLVLISSVFAVLIAVIGYFISLLNDVERTQTEIENKNSKSVQLAYELRQSSNDLTLFARLYSVTGKIEFEHYFKDILSVRNGEKPHPGNTQLSYWNQVSSGDIPHKLDGKIYSIEQRMKELNFSEQEHEKLRQAKQESDDLVNIENKAMHAVKGLFVDNEGGFSVKGEPDLQLATQLLHGQGYLAAKSKIMQRIDEFFELLEARSEKETVLINARYHAITMVIVALVFIMVGYSIFVFFLLRERVINPLSNFEAVAKRIGDEDYAQRFESRRDDEIGSLSEAFNTMIARIQERTARLRSIIDNAADGIIVLNDVGQIIEFSPSASRMFGYTPNEILGESMTLLIPERFRDRHENGLKQINNDTGKDKRINRSVEVYGLKKNGDEFPLELSVGLTYLNGQNLFTGILRDITDRKEAEEESLIQQNRLDMALQGANAGLWDWNAATNELIVSELWNTMLGYSQDELNQRYGKRAERFFELVHPDDLPVVIELLEKHINGETDIYRAEFRMRTSDEQWKWILDIGKASVRDSEGKGIKLLGIHLDIDETKKMQMEVLKARDVAEEATKAKSDFLANMSHEIRTPMNAIIGMSGLALSTDLNKKQRNYIEKVNRSSVSLLGIINDILDFSKIEAGKLDMEEIDFRLEDVMDNLANLLGLKSEEKGLELLFDVAADVPTALVGDPLRLGQMLVNIGSNAVKFTEQGQIVVSVRVEQLYENKTTLSFSVKDSGIGMSPDQQQKLFKSFSQADTSTTRKYGGSGLGLAICKRLCTMMGGEVSVISAVDEGSTFTLTANFGLQKGVPIGRVRPELPELKGLKVLVVDDNAMAREILTELLNSFDFNVTAVSSAEKAVCEVKSDGYDLILMDWKMPRIDGIAASKEIRTYQPDLPIILITAYSRDDALQVAEHEEVNFNHVLTKPIAASNMLDAVMEAFGHEISDSERLTLKSGKDLDSAHKLRGAKVLLVEDNDINQELAFELLSNGGMTVIVAENGQEALDILSEESFDGVLMDCQMPVMDGYTATRELRKEARFADLPVIAMTANVMAGDREKAIDAGMNDHIPKPINVHEMFQTMAKWITASAPQTLVQVDSDQISEGAFPELAGVDTQAGLEIAQQNTKLYRKLLGKFRHSFSDLENQLKQQSTEDNARLIHTLKGTAGNIGASEVAKAALKLEEAIAAGGSVMIERCHNELMVLVNRVTQAISELDVSVVEPSATEPVEVELDLEKEQLLIQQLRALLEDDDTDALELLDELEAMPVLSFDKSKLKALSKAIGEYDFDSALDRLNEI